MALAGENHTIKEFESFHIADQHTSSYITPGLISLKLRIVNTLDLHMIQEAKLDVIQSKKDEHPMLQNVQDNIIALLQTKIPRERYIARETLERIIRDDPNHLNALADLEHIYRDLNRISDANDCKTKIARILAGTSSKDIESKQISLLEQGYAIRMDKTLINENTIDSKVSELQTLISTELKNSSGQRRNCLAKSLHSNKQMLQHLQESRKHRTLDEPIIRINSSVQKFDAVLELFPDKKLHPVWIFNFAKSLNQYCNLIGHMSAIDSKDRQSNIKDVTVRAIQLFWQITKEQTDKLMLIYVARSYAYIGHILTKRKYLFRDESIPYDFLTIPDFNTLLENPFIMLERAFSLAPKDVTVLNRYGRSLWHESKSLDSEKQIEFLKRAEHILSKSIESENKRNWFAFSSRQMVRKDIAFHPLELSKIEYFELAREDGFQSFCIQTTLKDMTILAEVCQILAKWPDITHYGPRFIKPGNKQFIIEAIDYLYYGLRLGDPIEFHSTQRMASCLADLGETSKAIEWQKRAWLLSKTETVWPLIILCLFLTLSFEEANKTADKKINQLLKDLLYFLKCAKDQYNYENKSKIYTILYKRRHKHVLHMFRMCIDELSPFDSKTKEVMLDYVQHVLKLPRLNEHEQESTKEIETLLFMEITEEKKEDDVQNIFKTKTVQPSTNTQSVSSEYEYDFFVCHSHTNADWVNSILLQHLENAYHEDNILRGCIADRDFQPGMSILKNIVKAIKQSCKIILILTNDFLNSTWCQFEIEQALLDGSEQDRIIPVLLQSCEIPEELKHLTYIDLTNDELNFEGLQRLKDEIK